MFFKKYKNHYSLNFFATCGWINLLGFLTSYLGQLVQVLFQKNESLDAIIPAIISINWFFVIYSVITFFIFMLENFYEVRINDTKFLNNGFIDFLRILGTFLASLPFAFLFVAFLFIKF